MLALLRHGESTWNAADVFTGWIDVGLSEHGVQQARQAGTLLAGIGYFPGGGAHFPSASGHRRSWRLNSNYHGALHGRGESEVRAEAAEQQFVLWRRGFRVRPPLGEPDDDLRYAALPPAGAGSCSAVLRVACGARDAA